MESKPMKAAELGRYVCVAQGGCLHTDRTISSDGVWVQGPDALNPDGHLYSSAHRDCYEAWAARERQVTEPAVTRLLDRNALLADLAKWWDSWEQRTDLEPVSVRAQERIDFDLKLDRGCPRRIAGSEFDQHIPEGTQNPYWEIIRQLPLDPIGLPWHSRPEPMLYWLGDHRDDHRFFADRFAMCATYSWAICSPGDIAWMKDVLGGRGVVEPGAGTGYWAWQMEQAGIDVAAYEPNEQEPGNNFARRTWTTMLRDDHSAPKHHPDRALFLCWPSYAEPWAAQALACYTGDLLIYCGEGEGGCTADDEFFQLLGAEWEEISGSPAHVSYWGIHDYLTACRRADR